MVDGRQGLWRAVSVGEGSLTCLRCVYFEQAGLAGAHGVDGVVDDRQGTVDLVPTVTGEDEDADVSAGQVLLVGEPLVGSDEEFVLVAFGLVEELAVGEGVPVTFEGGVRLVVG